MDKSGSVAKAIVAAPTFDPVRQVEFGCRVYYQDDHLYNSNTFAEHFQDYMGESPEIAEKFTNSYVSLNSMLGRSLEIQTTHDPKDTKKLAMTTLKPTFLCLNCAVISSAEGRDEHAKVKKHMWCKDA